MLSALARRDGSDSHDRLVGYNFASARCCGDPRTHTGRRTNLSPAGRGPV